jgi:hypothetical protein
VGTEDWGLGTEDWGMENGEWRMERLEIIPSCIREFVVPTHQIQDAKYLKNTYP